MPYQSHIQAAKNASVPFFNVQVRSMAINLRIHVPKPTH
jgi:hypothetical protein